MFRVPDHTFLGRAYLSYTPYGFSVNSGHQRFAYHGNYIDPLTRHYHFGHGYRQFAPCLMRFTAPDVLSPFQAGGINAYAFMLNDPANGADPSGAYKISGVPLVNTDHHVIFVSQAGPRQPKILNVLAHASPGKIKVGNTRYNAAEFNEYLKSLKLRTEEFDYRIIGCRTAEAGEDGVKSFIESFSNITNRQVEGYAGLATYKLMRNIDPVTKQVRVEVEIPEVNPFKPGTEQFNKFNYAPVVIKPAAAIRGRN